MGKTKRKERNENEFFKGQIRKLESENRQLRKRLKMLDKREHLYEDLVEAVAENIVVNVDENCRKCRVGTLVPVDLKHVKYLVCTECKDRKKQ